nr:TetR/AcrR family transcriptional regulator [Calderihabitans maritimus]
MGNKSGDKYGLILEAAVKVFAENGYHNSQVSKIASEAGVADGTIYLYFQNKKDILISLFREKMGNFIEQVKRELEELSDPVAKLKRLIELHFSHLEADKNLATVIQIQLRQSDPEIRSAITGPLKEYFRLMEEILAEGKASGCFYPDIDVRLARSMIFGTLDEVATCWVLSRRDYRLSDQVEEVFRLLVRGLAVNSKLPSG